MHEHIIQTQTKPCITQYSGMPVHHSGTQVLQCKQIFLGKDQKDFSSLANREPCMNPEATTLQSICFPMQTSKHRVYPLMWMLHRVIPGPNEKTAKFYEVSNERVQSRIFLIFALLNHCTIHVHCPTNRHIHTHIHLAH